MRFRIGIWFATLGSASAVVIGVASCSSSPSAEAPSQGSDASLADATTTDSAEPDTSTVGSDDSGNASDVSAPADAGCAPRSGYQPGAYVPAAHGAACLASALPAALAADCFADGSTLEQCEGFGDSGIDGGPSTAACLACLLSPEASDAGYGPVIDGVISTLNVAGCIELADTTEAGASCAAITQSVASCAEFACASSCPVTDDPSRAAYVACTRAAMTGVCNVLNAAAANCIGEELEAGKAAAGCVGGPTDAGQALTMFRLFCGN